MNNKTFRKGYMSLISFLFLYSLYVPTKTKQLFSMKIDDIYTNNLLILIPVVCLILLIKYKYINKENLNLFIILLTLLLTLNTLNLYKSESTLQYFYSMLVFFLPIPLFFFVRQCTKEEYLFLIRFFIINTLIYSLLAVLFSANFAFFMKLAGNNYLEYQNYRQYRAPMMLGTSITVSNYLVLSLPFSLYYFNIAKNKWKIITFFSIISNIFAVVFLLSRLATVVTVIIIFIHVILEKVSIKKILFGFFSLFLMIFIIYSSSDYFDFSRINIFSGNTDSNSNSLRYLSAMLALYIWSKNIFIGTSMGRYFKRVYTDINLNIDGHRGLVDPHNTFVLILSEQGIIGFILLTIIFIGFIKLCLEQSYKGSRQSSLIFILAFVLISFGGSHLFLSISYGTIFWIYSAFYTRLDYLS